MSKINFKSWLPHLVAVAQSQLDHPVDVAAALTGRELSGGSAANTVAGLAAMGLSTGFIGQLGDDQLGEPVNPVHVLLPLLIRLDDFQIIARSYRPLPETMRPGQQLQVVVPLIVSSDADGHKLAIWRNIKPLNHGRYGKRP